MVPSDTDAVHDPLRLLALEATGLLDSPPEEAFDRLTRIAARALGVPVALVSLVDDHRQFFKSSTGLPAGVCQTDLPGSFCQHVVATALPLRIDDSRAHPLVADSPLIDELGVEAYAGIPLRDGHGNVLGSFCAIDHVPRRWTDEQLATLEDLAASVTTEIALRAALQDAHEQAERLRTTHELLSGIIDNAEAVVYAKDRDGRFTLVNPAFERTFGVREEALLGKADHEVWDPDVADAFVANDRRVLDLGGPLVLEEQAPGDDGPHTYTSVKFPLRDAAGAISGLAGIATDITARYRAEAALRLSEERHRDLVDELPQVIFRVDPRGRWAYLSPSWTTTIGVGVPETLGTSWLEHVHPEDREAALAALTPLGRGEQSAVTHEHRYVRADGELRWAKIIARRHEDEHGALAGVAGTFEDVTPRVLAGLALQASEQRFRLMLENLPDALVGLYDRDLRCVHLAGPMLARSGLDTEGLLGRTLQESTDPSALAQIMPMFEAALAGTPAAFEYPSRRSDEELVWGVQIVPYRASEGAEVSGVMMISRDVTETRRAEAAVREAEDRFRLMFEHAPIGMARAALDGTLQEVNPALSALTGYAPEALCQATLEAIIHPEDLADARADHQALQAGRTRHTEREVRLVHLGGEPVIVSLHASLVLGDDGRPTYILKQVLDVTERKRFEERLRFMADHDPLTGLCNRRRFEQELDRHVAHVERHGSTGAVIVLDIDHFKVVNDTLGHAVGDQLIISAAQVLGECLRDTDVLARLGGDEFAILLPDATREQAARVADRLLAGIRGQTALLDGRRHHPVTISVGVAVFDGPGTLSAEDAIVGADLAMYDAKEAGRDRACFFAAGGRGQSRTKARVTWADRIEEALQTDGFELHAQPIVHLQTAEVTQHELLLRMLGPDGDLIPPAAFLSVAERYGMVTRVDRWVAGRAIGLLADLGEAGRGLRLEVNLSGHSIGDEHLLEAIEADLRRTGVDPRSLIFEVTETAAVANIQRARRFAEQLGDLGCRFALDDFGAGFGSFYYLKHLPFDFLKIDGEFVANCVASRTDQLVIEAVVQIARGLRKETIAEYVQDADTRRLLRRLGVDYAQGAHIGEAGPLALMGLAPAV